tara:strand:+ start:979 stop:1506 length:528 start_codon:yes stop_codon:yes gene_type:complete
MTEHVLSPDGKQVWSDDNDLPPWIKSKWVDLKRWNEWLSNSRECPLCYSKMEIDLEEEYQECSHCWEGFNITNKKPLTIEHLQAPIMKFYLPIKLEHPLINKKGMAFTVRTHPDSPPDFDEMIDAINVSMRELKESILGIVQKAIDDQDDDWYDIYEKYDLIEEDNPIYVLDEEE